MKEKLIIKNFGPLKSVDLDLGKMTILIGEQATGKSTIAKVLAVCRYFSYLVSVVPTKEGIENFNMPFEEGLRQWGLTDFIQNGSIIKYENETYWLEGIGILGKVETKKEGLEISNNKKNVFFIKVYGKTKKFKGLFDTIETIKGATFFGELTVLPYSFYETEVSKVMNNPFYVPTERGLQSIFSLGKSSIQNISDSLFNQFAKMDMFARNFQSETEIKPLEIEYKNVNGQGFIKNKSQTEFSSLYHGASGYQSTIPVVLAIKYYTEKKKKPKTFIIEEPELNLFPKAQKKLMEFFVENINKNGHSFLLPTHSPYFLSAINDLLMAYKKGKTHPIEVEEIIKKESWLNPDDLSVYELKDGLAYNIFNKELNLIGENIIDDVSDEMNDEFDTLLYMK